ncbi:hypothetical protein FA13DRAFT_1788288 [Coprinellus micaceus]|uniref:TspO/MBR-related protein n=1 Tax=Coprinellus micaceus TaxID=71717 RepID=A0A4Y7TP18_COPMI|nr:hypothetical protein FA13DRAFT_1788288 [Coprinellus micaceus]
MSFHLPGLLLAIPRNPVTAVGLPLIAGFLSGSPSTTKVQNSNWYYTTGSNLPERYSPLFGPLYTARWDTRRTSQSNRFDNAITTTTRDKLTLGLALYYAQLGLNFAWTPLFFGAHKTGLALVDSAALTLTTWYMTKLFDRPTNGKATWFLLPYCGWLAYATYLNAGIWWLNGGEKKAKSF